MNRYLLSGCHEDRLCFESGVTTVNKTGSESPLSTISILIRKGVVSGVWD